MPGARQPQWAALSGIGSTRVNTGQADTSAAVKYRNLETGCQRESRRGRPTWFYQGWYLKCVTTECGRGISDRNRCVLKPPSLGKSMSPRVWRNPWVSTSWPESGNPATAQWSPEINPRARPGKGTGRGRGRRGRSERTRDPEGNLLGCWVVFDPIRCIPGAEDTRGASEIN